MFGNPTLGSQTLHEQVWTSGLEVAGWVHGKVLEKHPTTQGLSRWNLLDSKKQQELAKSPLHKSTTDIKS